MATWLRRYDVQNISKKRIEQLVSAAKTYAPGKGVDVDKGHMLHVNQKFLALQPRER